MPIAVLDAVWKWELDLKSNSYRSQSIMVRWGLMKSCLIVSLKLRWGFVTSWYSPWSVCQSLALPVTSLLLGKADSMPWPPACPLYSNYWYVSRSGCLHVSRELLHILMYLCKTELIKNAISPMGIAAYCMFLLHWPKQESSVSYPELNRCCSAPPAGNEMVFADWYQLFHYHCSF